MTLLSRCALFATTGSLAGAIFATAQQPQIHFSTAHRDGEHFVSQSIDAGKSVHAKDLASGKRTALSITAADLRAAGTADLLTGYAVGSAGVLLVQQGNPRAASPSATELTLLASGQTIAPFAEKAQAVDLPVRPDLLTTADLHGFGHLDVLVGAKGGSTAYVLAGDGRGGLGEPEAIPLQGALTSLTTWRKAAGQRVVAAAVCAKTGCGVQIVELDGSAITFAPLPSAATSLQMTQLSGSLGYDLLAVTSNGVQIIDGDSLLAGSPEVNTLSVPGAVAAATGMFAYDRRMIAQVAVLDSNAVLHVYARAGLIDTAPTAADLRAYRARTQQRTESRTDIPKTSTLAWQEVERIAGVGPGGAALMMRARVSGGGYDDLTVLAGKQYVTVSHPLVNEAGKRHSVPTVTVDSSSTDAAGAVPLRLSADSRMGIVSLGSAVQPMYTVPTTNRTMTVNTTTDAVPNTASQNACKNGTAGCTLRAAFSVSNADEASTSTSKVDTINVPAGTYTFTATNNGNAQDSYGDANYYLPVESSLNLVGAGAASTLINANHLDKVISTNESLNNTYDVYFSNLTLENGTNVNGSGDINPYGGIMDGDLGGPGVLAMTNMVLTTGKSIYYGGGAIELSNYNDAYGSNPTPQGLLEVDNSTISNNQSASEGGGILLGSQIPGTFTNDQFSGNTSSTSVGSGGLSAGLGGALVIESTSSDSQAAAAVSITNCTFTSNSVSGGSGSGGAIAVVSSQPSISGSTFTNNSASSYGGALDINNTAYPFTITTSTFTGNTATSDGRAIGLEGHSGAPTTDNTFTLQYSRIHGNTGGGNAVSVAYNTAYAGYGTLIGKDNWWGCNGPATGTGCDIAAAGAGSHGALTLTPYTNLKVVLSTTTPSNTASFTATGSLGQDSSGTMYSLANAAAYDGVAATLSIVQNGGGTTTNSSQTVLSNSVATSVSYAAITTTATASAAGAGTATVTVDGTAVSAGFTVTAPDLTVSSSHTGNFKAGDTGDTYTLTATNSGTGATTGTVSLVDALPSGFTATAMSGTGWTCNTTTFTCTRSDALSSSSSYPAVTLTVSVAASNAGTYTNSVSVSGGGESTTSNDAGTDSTIVVGQPTISEAFSPSTVAPNVNSTVTFTLGNPSANPVSLASVAFSDTLPTGLKIAEPSGAVSSCSSGTVTATAGGSSIALSGATLTAGSTCTVSVNLNSAAVASYTNTTGAVTSTTSNAGGTASATLTVTVTPTKLVFTASPATPINAGGNAGSITVSLQDASNNVATNNSSTSVTLTVTGPSSYSQTYTATASSGVATFNLTSVALSIGGTYTYTATATSLTQAQATEVVVAPPTITEAFSPTSVAPNTNSTVTFTLGNPSGNGATLTGVAFTDTLPTGLGVATPSGASTTCTSGTMTAVAGGGSISLSGASISAGNTCTVSVNVVSASIGSYTNTTGAITASNSGAGSTASATLSVTVTPSKLLYTTAPATPIVAGGNAGTVRVALEDSAGNIATNNSTTVVTLAVTGPSSYSQSYTATASSGVATFNLSSVALSVSGSYTYTATATALTQAQTTQIVNSGAASSFTVTGLGPFAAPGITGTATVTAHDSYGNVATTFTGTATFTSSDSLATLPSPYAYVVGDAGVHSFSITLNTAGTQSVTAGSGAITGTESGIFVGDAIYLINADGTLVKLSEGGSQSGSTGSSGSTSTLGGAAVDNNGTTWSVTNANSSVTYTTRTDTTTTLTGRGLNLPTSIAVDGFGQIWITNSNNSITLLNNAGAALSPANGYTGTASGYSAPSAVAIDLSGSVWVANSGNNSITKIIGGAFPTVAPLVKGIINTSQGARP